MRLASLSESVFYPALQERVRLRLGWLSRTIRGKILLAFLSITLLTCCLGVYTGFAIGRSASLVTKTFDQSLMSINYARAASADFAGMQSAVARRWLTTETDKRAKFDRTIRELRSLLSDDLTIASDRAQSSDATAAAKSVREAVDEWDAARNRLTPGADSGVHMQSLDRYADVVSQEIDLLINYTAGDAFTYRQSALDSVSRYRQLAFAASALAALLSILVTWLLARHISVPLAAASDAARNIAAGRLEEAIPDGSGDELGSLLDSMKVMRNNIKMMMEREVSLRRSAQSRLGDALESSPEGILMVDANGQVELANSQATNFFGPLQSLSLPDIMGKGFSDVPGVGARELALSGRGGEMQLPDGRYLRANISATQDGGYIALFGDISLLKEQEANLKSANHLLDAALENMSQGLCLYDADRRLKVINRRFCEIFGLKIEQLAEGITFEQVIELSVEAGNHITSSSDALIAEETEFALAKPNGTRFQELSHDRVVAITRTALADGGWVATYEDVTERRRAEAQVVFMARHDVLTRLSNRLLFGERVELAIAEIARGSRGFSIFCLDLDHFKQVNDTLGHPFGDRLLQCVATRLLSCVRSWDTVARLGGDEFAILLSEVDRPDELEVIARRIVNALSQPYEIDGQAVSVSVSIGMAVAPQDGTSYEGLLKNADVALYLAKRDGRGTWRFFEAQMEIELQLRRAMELDLREAIASEQFEVHYQPIFDLARCRVACFEALVRWRHPERGLVSPAEFIPLAEEIGLIVDIGKWVLEQACVEALNWPDHTSVAVNVSATQFKDDRFLDVVNDALAKSGLDPRRLELEVTETVLLSDTTNNLETLQKLREVGICISMDDFGTGYSSLSYLSSFPFDKIKIDQSFVRNLSVNDGQRAIIRAIVALGSSLGIRTVAEGVETYEQLESLSVIGCNQVQGYYFSKPVPSPEIQRVLDKWNGRRVTVAAVLAQQA